MSFILIKLFFTVLGMACVTPLDVVIVGAGPAGIAAACRLLSKGIDRIVILEAENRIGGRVHSIPFGMDNRT